MKTLIVLVSLVSLNSFATDLKCQISQNGKIVGSVILGNIESQDRLYSTLPDQSLFASFEDYYGTSTASFSNECDNMYHVSLKTEDVKLLKLGRKQGIVGQLVEKTSEGTQFKTLRCRIK